MGRQRNKPHSKAKEESPGRFLNEIEASKLSDIECKTMVIRKFNELRRIIKNDRDTMKNLLQTTSSCKRTQKLSARAKSK